MAQLVEHRGTQPRRLRKQKHHKFAYLTMKNTSFARFACALFMFGNFVHVLALSTTCMNDLFCSCADDVSDMMTNVQFYLLTSETLVRI